MDPSTAARLLNLIRRSKLSPFTLEISNRALSVFFMCCMQHTPENVFFYLETKSRDITDAEKGKENFLVIEVTRVNNLSPLYTRIPWDLLSAEVQDFVSPLAQIRPERNVDAEDLMDELLSYASSEEIERAHARVFALPPQPAEAVEETSPFPLVEEVMARPISPPRFVNAREVVTPLT